MKDTELRIGNIVEFSSPNLRLNIHEKFHTVSSMDIINFSSKKILLESIPLTEDILLMKAGFKLDYFSKYYHRGDFKIYQDNGGYFVVYKGVGLMYYNYLHLLQNLYQSLTGEELILQ